MKEPTDKRMTKQSRNFSKRGALSMSDRQFNAYFMSRDTLRRIQRASALFDEHDAMRLRQASS